MEADKRDLVGSIKVAFWVGLIPFLVYLFSFITQLDFGFLGVLPRYISGLKGIIFSPLLHGSWQHLFSNLPPLMFSVFLIHFFYKRHFKGIIFMNYLLTGLVVWLLGQEVYHIGASGVVYALVSFIFWTGIFVRNFKSVLLALLVLVLYSGMFAGILPSAEIVANNISWESHLMGGIVGIFTAWMFKNTITKEAQKQKLPPSYSREEVKVPYFSDDVFNKTLWERYVEEQQKRLNQDL